MFAVEHMQGSIERSIAFGMGHLRPASWGRRPRANVFVSKCWPVPVCSNRNWTDRTWKVCSCFSMTVCESSTRQYYTVYIWPLDISHRPWPRSRVDISFDLNVRVENHSGLLTTVPEGFSDIPGATWYDKELLNFSVNMWTVQICPLSIDLMRRPLVGCCTFPS